MANMSLIVKNGKRNISEIYHTVFFHSIRISCKKINYNFLFLLQGQAR
jgi:hypothetical protein